MARPAIEIVSDAKSKQYKPLKAMAFTNVDKFPDGTQTARDSSYFENSLTLQKQLSYGK